MPGPASSRASASAPQSVPASPAPSQDSTVAPRYVPLPDVLRRLRRRFPSVMECVCMECTRCHQWVMEDVLTRVPEEIAEAPVRGLGTAPPGTTQQAVTVASPQQASVSASPCSRSTGKRQRDEEAPQSTAATAQQQPQGWHSERLRRKMEEAAAEARRQQQQQDEANAKRSSHLAPSDSSSSSEKALLAAVEAYRTDTLSSHKKKGSTRAAAAPAATVDAAHTTMDEVLFIPNPVNFVCRWASCAMGDRLADLRRAWTGGLLGLADELLETGGAGHGKTSHSTRISDDAEEGSTHVKTEKKEEEEGGEGGEGEADKASRAIKKIKRENKAVANGASAAEGENVVSALSPTTAATAATASSPLSSSVVAYSGLADVKTRRAALNEALEKELGLRRSSRLAERRAGADQPHCGCDGEWRGKGHCTSTPALLALLDPQLLLKSQPASSLSLPLPPPLPTVLSTSASATKEAEARRQQWLHHTWVQSAATFLVQRDRAATLSALCWVVCESCGKVRRVAQPFPGGGAPFVCALSAVSGGSCAVSEAEGLLTYTNNVVGEQLVHAAQLSPFMEVVPPYKVTSAIVEEPVLHAVLSVLEVEEGQPPLVSALPTADFNALVAQCVPLLRDLTVAIRKRSTGSWAKQLALTPADVRRKREHVLREVFLRAEEKNAAEATARQKEAKARARGERKGSRPASVSSSSPSSVPSSQVAAHSRGRKAEPHKTQSRKSSGAAEKTRQSKRAALDSVVVGDSHAPVDETGHVASPCLVSSTEKSTPPAVSREPVVKRKRGRPRKSTAADHTQPGGGGATRKKGGAAHGDGGGEEEEEEEIIHWVQCDECSKWRVIPEPIADSVEHWTCSMRVDPVSGHRTSCREMDDEKKMAREGRRVREV